MRPLKLALKTWLGMKIFSFGGRLLLRGGALAAMAALAKAMMPSHGKKSKA